MSQGNGDAHQQRGVDAVEALEQRVDWHDQALDEHARTYRLVSEQLALLQRGQEQLDQMIRALADLVRSYAGEVRQLILEQRRRASDDEPVTL